MKALRETRKQFRELPLARRRGAVGWGWLVGLVSTPVVAYAAWQYMPGKSEAGAGPIPHAVERGVFIFEVTERGEVESSNNVEVRCDVKTRTSTGMVIRKLIPEGAFAFHGCRVNGAINDEIGICIERCMVVGCDHWNAMPGKCSCKRQFAQSLRQWHDCCQSHGRCPADTDCNSKGTSIRNRLLMMNAYSSMQLVVQSDFSIG